MKSHFNITIILYLSLFITIFIDVCLHNNEPDSEILFFSFGKKWCFNAKKTSCFVLLCHFFQESCYVIITREREDSCFKNKNNEKQAKMKWPNVWLVGWLVVIIIITSKDGQWRKRIMFVCVFQSVNFYPKKKT